MSKPLRITCQDIKQIPPIDELRQLATHQQHVVLVFPTSKANQECPIDKQSIIQRLANQLPDHSVFDSGEKEGKTWLTITKVISKGIIIENANLFLTAIENFSTLANQLITKLAHQLQFPVEKVSITWRFQIDDSLTIGELDDDWVYWFHGYECRFENIRTGQVADIRLSNFGDKHALLDPCFLGEYIHTTPTEALAAQFIKDEFHDTARILQILREQGYLGPVIRLAT